jgi:hypothetical protein
MSPPSSAKSRRALVVAVSALLAAVGVFFAWRLSHPMAGTEEISLFLEKTVEPGRLRFAVESVDVAERAGSEVRFRFAAKAWPMQPLFVRLDNAVYLRSAYHLDPETSAEAHALLQRPGAQTDPDAVLAKPVPADPFAVAILENSVPADASFSYEGVMDAHWMDGAWVLTLVTGNFVGAAPKGEPRPGPEVQAYVAGTPGDDERLGAIVADFGAFSRRLADVRRSKASSRAAAIAVRRDAFLALVAAGHVFRGQAVRSGEQTPTPLTLEVLEVTPEQGVTAILRNDGGWRSARLFQGTWTADDEFSAPMLELSSQARQAVRGAGPFLENTQPWTMELHPRRSGGLSGQDANYSYEFRLLEPGQVSGLRERLEREFTTAVAATDSGRLYQGTAVSRATGTSEPVLLRFGRRPGSGDSVDAALESPSSPWKRSFRGSIIGNARRSGGQPILMRSGAGEAAPDAPVSSALGDRNELDARFGVDGDSLVGGDDQFSYRFAPAGEAYLKRMAADRAARADRFWQAVRAGITYDGTLHEEQGFVSHVRLEISRVNRDSGGIAASIRSQSRRDAYRDFTGTCDASTSSLVLNASSRGNPGSDDGFDVPFLKGKSGSTLHLALESAAISGNIEGDTSWTVSFPVSVFMSAPSESPGSGGPAANGAAFPRFPGAAGAYLLSEGTWVPLPRNGGHVATEELKEKEGDLRLPTNIVSAVDEALNHLTAKKEKRKVSFLEFDGKEPRPASSTPYMVILFAGELPKANPQLELAATEVTKEGQRRIEVHEGHGSGFRFDADPVAAFVRGAGPGYLLFTTTSPLDPGSYAFNADGGYEVNQN